MKFGFWWNKHVLEFLSLKNQKVSETSFLILKYSGDSEKFCFCLIFFLFKFACRRKIARIFISSSQIDKTWNTLTRFLCQVFLFANLGEKKFHGSASISMIHFWRESKAMSRSKSIIVKFFSIKCLQWIANLG
jgi:hypothetical protein